MQHWLQTLYLFADIIRFNSVACCMLSYKAASSFGDCLFENFSNLDVQDALFHVALIHAACMRFRILFVDPKIEIVYACRQGRQGPLVLPLY